MSSVTALHALPSPDGPDLAAAERAAAAFLRALGISTDSESLRATPGRMTRAYAELFTPGAFEPTTFANDEGYDELVLAHNIPAAVGLRASPAAVHRHHHRHLHPARGAARARARNSSPSPAWAADSSSRPRPVRGIACGARRYPSGRGGPGTARAARTDRASRRSVTRLLRGQRRRRRAAPRRGHRRAHALLTAARLWSAIQQAKAS